jgi:hypothetical protein
VVAQQTAKQAELEHKVLMVQQAQAVQQVAAVEVVLLAVQLVQVLAEQAVQVRLHQ